MAVFDFTDASFKGDTRWSSASSWTGYAPIVVSILAILSIIEIIVGVVWIVSIQSAANNLSFAQVIQPLVIPGLSLFNTIPSLHLHVLVRSNKPIMAIYFSSVMGALYLVSAIMFLPPCTDWNESSLNEGSYKRTECPSGSRKGLWAAVIAFQFISAVGYAVHVAMAVKVRRVIMRRELGEKDGTLTVVINEEAKAKREEEARQRWRMIRDL